MKRLVHLHHYRALLRSLFIAVFIGVAAALAVWLFHRSMIGLEWLLLGNADGSLVAAAAALPGWRRALTPALGGLAAGVLLYIHQRYRHQRPAAPTDYMEAIETGNGKLDTGASLVKCLASLLVVSSGSAIGREGAMILLAALVGSLFAQRFTHEKEWKLWVACAAAAGMASAYHAPLAGSLFIAEILFGTLMLASLGPVVIAAVSALLMTNLLNGGQAPLYLVTPLAAPLPTQYLLMALVGVVAGAGGPLFLWLMTATGHAFRSLRLKPPLQLALGGLIVGLLSLLFPQVWGQRLQRGAGAADRAAGGAAAGGDPGVQTVGDPRQQRVGRAGRGLHPDAVRRRRARFDHRSAVWPVAGHGYGGAAAAGADRHGYPAGRHHPCADHGGADGV